MQSQTAQAHHITDIIKVMNGGIEFYQEAKHKLDNRSYSALFDRMIHAKSEAIAELQPFAIQQKGEIELGSSNLVKARELYTKLMTNVTSETKEFAYADQLEEVEDKVLEELDLALERNQPQDCEVTLRRVKVRMQECHDEMKALQNVAQQ